MGGNGLSSAIGEMVDNAAMPCGRGDLLDGLVGAECEGPARGDVEEYENREVLLLCRAPLAPLPPPPPPGEVGGSAVVGWVGERAERMGGWGRKESWSCRGDNGGATDMMMRPTVSMRQAVVGRKSSSKTGEIGVKIDR
jgi:hypothetical protein